MAHDRVRPRKRKTVSYTHLDVYKRQLYQQAGQQRRGGADNDIQRRDCREQSCDQAAQGQPKGRDRIKIQ